ncbi:Molybdate ABC transporter, periplasmic binding protein [Desulfonema limicola]|uniref:Molybdate ABC transporter, periplasmic binding protein n=1 Tax=Desulfonema limicola TaxID=45656 RepID=A0A975B6L6_9BACT|nr:molybdate ABC transporter substrate-binding protein [Desulfonema limicola]QTA79592.1 Molybdate ABC transporter, periplasmic binding protein [Desulfonema limicola]
METLKFPVNSCFVFFFIMFCIIPSTVLSWTESEILVFAGAGIHKPLNEIGKIFEEKNKIKVIYDFAGSGLLGNKILIGQKPDIFIPGSDKWAKILQQKGFIKDYIPIAFHTPVIITPKGDNRINSLKDFVKPDNKIVLGDVKAAAIGDISSKIFKKAGIDESKINVAARGMTVNQLIFWIEGNNAHGSIVWNADAVISGKVKIIDIPEAYNIINIVPVCRINEHKEAVSKYVDYILSPEAKEIFKKQGFKVIEK